MPDLRLLPTALRELGPSTVLQYAVYQCGLRSGWLRWRTRRQAWDARRVAQASNGDAATQPPFFFDPAADLAGDLRQAAHGQSDTLTAQADDVLQGRFALFGSAARQLGFPPAWNTLPWEGQARPGRAISSERHWTSYRTDGELDWRLLWELSRFGWIFTLGRAYRLTGQARYWDGCWALLDSWRSANPPNQGPQWISGQEVALRILALAFGWFAFAPALRRQPERAAALRQLVAAHAARLPPTLSYARAQRNNHLISESVGLYTAGTLFPGLPGASRWRRLGTRWLRAALKDQVFADGGYIQHSLNYHRLALGLGLWALCLARAQGEPLPEDVTTALRRMTHFLRALVGPDSGRAPRLGHDDGSQPLPLSTCAHADMRPILQLAEWALFGRPAYPPGPWDEPAFWLGLPHARSAPGGSDKPVQNEQSPDYPQAGIYLLRGQRTRGTLRCGRFRSRPAHSDQLHFDLWRDGINLAADPGSFSYAGPDPGGNALARAAVHNGPWVAGREPMHQAGRFLWVGWAQGTLVGRWRSPSGGLEVLGAEHAGYAREGWTCRRTVARAGEALWLVIDELLGRGRQALQVAWTVPDQQGELRGSQLRWAVEDQEVRLMFGPQAVGIGLYRAGEHRSGDPVVPPGEARLLGWYAPTYGSLEPAATLVGRLEGELPLRLLSWWSLGGPEPDPLRVDWATPGGAGLPITRLRWGGEEVRL